MINSSRSIPPEHMHPGTAHKPRVLYLINAMNTGGAELGLLTLIDYGFFAEVELDVLLLHVGDRKLLTRLEASLGKSHVQVIDPREKLRPVAMAKAMLALRQQLSSQRYDMLIASLAQSNMVALLVARLFPSVKMVTFFHNSSFSKAVYESVIHRLAGRIDVCLCDNVETYKAISRKLPAAPERTWHCVPLFVAQDVCRKSDYRARDIIHVLSVGRLNTQKNYMQSIRAIRLLADRGVTAHLHIAGEGELREAIVDLASELGVVDHIHLLGFTDDWSRLVDHMDMYLLASTREGLSIATLEAMSYGLPVVSANVGGIQEYGRHMQNMLIMSSTDSATIAESVQRLANSQTLRETLGRNGRDTAIQLYGPDAVMQQLTEIKGQLFQ